MGLLEQWRESVYDENMAPSRLKKIWDDYFAKEKKVYIELLKEPETVVSGTVSELAEKYGISVYEMAGFLDGIDESLKKPNKLKNLKESTKVQLGFDIEKLYRNMVKAKADWLYNLPEWDAILSKDERKELYRAEKLSGTVIKEKKPGRNDPCPCGSGKKYKHCCGRS